MTDSQLFCHLSLSGDRVFICHIPWLPCQDTSGKNVTRTKSNMKIFTWRHFLPFLSTCHIDVWIFNNIIIEEYSMCHYIFHFPQQCTVYQLWGTFTSIYIIVRHHLSSSGILEKMLLGKFELQICAICDWLGQAVLWTICLKVQFS